MARKPNSEVVANEIDDEFANDPAQATDTVAKSYAYSGPITPLDAGGEIGMLHPGKTYSNLPEDNPQVRRLIDRKMLVAVAVKTNETQE
jgi:hypothetical protein